MASIPLKSRDSLPPRRGIIFILSAPSGAGKTTIWRAALKAIAGLEFSVSLTTRAPREGEADGIDYSFVSEEEFKRRQSSGELAEWARVFESFYGTPRAPLDAAIASGRDILLDIDIQGARQIRAIYPARCGCRLCTPAELRRARGAPARARHGGRIEDSAPASQSARRSPGLSRIRLSDRQRRGS